MTVLRSHLLSRKVALDILATESLSSAECRINPVSGEAGNPPLSLEEQSLGNSPTAGGAGMASLPWQAGALGWNRPQLPLGAADPLWCCHLSLPVSEQTVSSPSIELAGRVRKRGSNGRIHSALGTLLAPL